jgi:hypothetical protein
MDDLLETTKTSETQEITADYFVLIQFSIKTAKMLYVGQVEEIVAFTYRVKFMRRHGEYPNHGTDFYMMHHQR